MNNVKIFLNTSSGLVPFDKENLPKEVKGALEDILNGLFPNEKELKPKKSKIAKEMTIPYYIWKIAERNKVSYHDVDRLLSNLWQVSPGAVIQVLARAIAMEMDLNYEDHIRTVDVKYFIDHIYDDYKIASSDLTGENYRDIGFFRNDDDAKTALEILNPLIEKTLKWRTRK